MKAVKVILIVLLVVIGLVLIYSFVAPKDYHLEEEVVIDAPYSLIVAQATHWENFQGWSPWSELDPNMELAYEGEPGKVGSKYTWKGNEDAGSGTQEITAVTDEKVDIAITFKEPFESEADTYFTFESVDEGVKVTWGMNSTMEWPWNVLTSSIKSSISKDYRKGLDSLKVRCENITEEFVVDGFWIRPTTFDSRVYIGKKGTVNWSDMQNFFSSNLGAASQAISAAGITPIGAPSGLYYVWDTENQKAEMMAAIPCAPGTKISGFDADTISGEALYVDYYGSYDGLGDAHDAIGSYFTKYNIPQGGVAIEEYLTDPGTQPDTSQWLTRITYLLK